IWWISWFGIIGSFLCVGAWCLCTRPFQKPAAYYLYFVLLVITGVLWSWFYAADARSRKQVEGEKNREVVVNLLTMTGTFLAIFTLLETLFFGLIAPRIW